MAATWNPELMLRSQELAAMETRAAGIPWSFSPVLDIGRQPLWPRFYETFGEDPYLATVMGVAFVRGLEGEDLAANTSVASSLKHYVGYSHPLNGRDRTPAWIPENYLREYFLPTFAAAVKAGARTVMVNSAEINGVPGHVNRHLLTDILRGELGFKGLVVSDWEDIKKLVTQWKVAADEKEATRLSVMAGIDMSMVPSDYSFADHLVALVKEGSVPVSRIDEAVRRILLVKFELGLFERPGPDASLKANFALNSSRDVALQAARESMVLLKNRGDLLPLARDRKVLVTGPTANSLISLNNGWTYVWQGSEESLYPKDRPTILQALEGKLGGSVHYEPGTRITRPPGSDSHGTPTDINEEVDIPAAVRAARDADVVVLCLGEGSYTETPGNITDLNLPDPQVKLAEAIQATGKPVVLVLVEGRPRIINRIAEKSDAILLALNPGNEGGVAVADVLFGDYNPSGPTPLHLPAHAQRPRHLRPQALRDRGHELRQHGLQPAVPLRPRTELHDLRLLRPPARTQTGALERLGGRERDGAQHRTTRGQGDGHPLRARCGGLAHAARQARPTLRTVYLEPGQSRTLTFTLRPEDLSFVGADNRTTIEPGDFDVMVGGLTERFMLQPGTAPARGRAVRSDAQVERFARVAAGVSSRAREKVIRSSKDSKPMKKLANGTLRLAARRTAAAILLRAGCRRGRLGARRAGRRGRSRTCQPEGFNTQVQTNREARLRSAELRPTVTAPSIRDSSPRSSSRPRTTSSASSSCATNSLTCSSRRSRSTTNSSPSRPNEINKRAHRLKSFLMKPSAEGDAGVRGEAAEAATTPVYDEAAMSWRSSSSATRFTASPATPCSRTPTSSTPRSPPGPAASFSHHRAERERQAQRRADGESVEVILPGTIKHRDTETQRLS